MLRGDHLLCGKCNTTSGSGGLVPFNSPINKSPFLNGRCTNCYQKYEHFEETVEKLAALQRQIEPLEGFSKLLTLSSSKEIREDIQEKTKELLDQLLRFSFPECESVSVSVNVCLEVIARCLQQSNESEDVQVEVKSIQKNKQKHQLPLLLRRTLPKKLQAAKVFIDFRQTGRYLRSLGFWSSSQSILDEDTAGQFGDLLTKTWKQLLEEDGDSGSVSDRLMSIFGELSFFHVKY